NPPGSGHTPFSKPGCRILVKLRQFDDRDLTQFAIDTTDTRGWVGDTLSLHEYGPERVSMRRVAAGRRFDVDAGDAGTEIFVVSGSLAFDGAVWAAESWLRFPPGDVATLTAEEPALVWIKTGHLLGHLSA
ncbi:MAG: cupin domain-containing protein, partial [Pseudomonadota bacterium]